MFEAVNGLPGALLWPVRVVMFLGTTTGAAIVAVVALLWAQRRGALGHSIAALLGSLLVAAALARVAAETLKRLVRRPRPKGFAAALHPLHVRDPTPGLGFPSAHAATSMALAVTLGAWWPRARWPLVAAAAVVALSRPYVGVHLPLDAAGGMALGVLAGAAGASAGSWLAGRQRSPRGA